jgi:hypothetical protein
MPWFVRGSRYRHLQLSPRGGWEEQTMNELVLPVPKTVSAAYIVPVPTPMSTAEARRQASRAVKARLTGPLRTLVAEWLAKGKVKIEVEAAAPPRPACWTRSCSALQNSGPS